MSARKPTDPVDTIVRQIAELTDTQRGEFCKWLVADPASPVLGIFRFMLGTAETLDRAVKEWASRAENAESRVAYWRDHIKPILFDAIAELKGKLGRPPDPTTQDLLAEVVRLREQVPKWSYPRISKHLNAMGHSTTEGSVRKLYDRLQTGKRT